MQKLECAMTDKLYTTFSKFKQSMNLTTAEAVESLLTQTTHLVEPQSPTPIPMSSILNGHPTDLKALNFDSSIKPEFRNNFNALPFYYRQKVYELLDLLINRIYFPSEFCPSQAQCFYHCFITATQHLCVYYRKAAPNNLDERGRFLGKLNFYMNISGTTRGLPIAAQPHLGIAGYTHSYILSPTDPTSKIWISNKVKFDVGGYYELNDNPLFDRILTLLGHSQQNPIAVQLGLVELQTIIDYIHLELQKYNIPLI